MKRILSLFLSVFFLVSPPAQAAGQPLSLLVDHGVPLTLSGAATSVFIANPDIADVQVMSPTQVMLFGKRTGETTFVATNARGTVLAQRTLVVSQDLTSLREELRAAIPGNNVSAKAVPGGIILTGTAQDPTAVTDAYKIAMRYLPANGDIINRVQIAGSNQIQIRVRFAEVQRNIDNSLGFNWQALLSDNSFAVGLATGASVSADSILGMRPNNTSLSTSNYIVGASQKFKNFSIAAVIDALEQEGLLTMLAEPNLTAMSGETANFLAGGEYPIPVPQGNGTISITYRSYGISLAFTPTVLNGNRISLHVRPEVSELSDVGAVVSNNITVPALVTRKAETTVEVASGESFAIAGLVNNKQRETVNKFPVLGDLPILGALFRSDHFINGQTELVVIVTPYIVKPSKHALSAPTDGYSPPSETERLGERRYSSGDPNARPISGEPTAVRTAPAPLPAPVTPVSRMEKPAAVVTQPEIQSPSLEPQTPTPLVLHPARDALKSGGLLVE
ncbi:MAG: type II and III secretion system protein family protein [Alphaproteobacteria bacterium]|nr:type II and III secretion system protein family protein [Alphaproteobacteria bacterium]